MPNQSDRRDYDLGASGSAQENFNLVASHLEALINQRDADVKNAMADYLADGVSELYAAKEQRWNAVANEVRTIIRTLRGSLVSNDETAMMALQRAKTSVEAI